MTSELERIYQSLPKIECKQLCQEACSFIVVTRAEKHFLTKMLNSDPTHKMDKFHHALFTQDDVAKKKAPCKMLDSCGNCTIYNIRPLICRLFGIVKQMKCPFGCIPEKWLSDNEAKYLFKKLKSIQIGRCK